MNNQNVSGRNVAAANSGLALWGLMCFVETFVQGSTFVLRMNISAKIPPQRQAANRWAILRVRISEIAFYKVLFSLFIYKAAEGTLEERR
jgi:hypothetical protein